MQDLPVLICAHSLYFIVSYQWEDLFFHLSVRSEQQKKSHNPISNQKLLADVPFSASTSKHQTHTATTQLFKELSHKKKFQRQCQISISFTKKSRRNFASSDSFSCPSYTCKNLFLPICLQDTKCICSALCSFHKRSKTINETSFILKVSKSKEET